MKKLFLLTLVLLLFGCAADTLNIITKEGKVKVYTERAETPEEQEKGLMFREILGENDGMLFVFDEPIQPSFWMKNTLISLDILFIDENLVIVDIIESMVPCKEDPCPVYPSGEYAKYALEVNSGFVKKEDIHLGDRVVI